MSEAKEPRSVAALNPRDSQILELLRGGAPIQRVVDIGRHRKSWNPIHVGTVVAFHLDDRPTLTVVPEPKPQKPRKVAECGTTSGYTRHIRRGEKACDKCAQGKRDYNQRRRDAKRATPTQARWRPKPFTGRATNVELTPTQIAVLGHLCRGLTNRRIGGELGITENTVKAHLKDVLAGLGASDRAHAVVLVMSEQVRVYERPVKGRSA